MNKLIMHPLSLRLQKMGCQASCLSYTSTRANKAKVFTAIDQAIDDENTVLVGHSLGGLVIHDYLRQGAGNSEYVRAVVTLGTPHQGAKIAQDLERLHLDKILGTATQFGLLPSKNGVKWEVNAPLGSIAGTRKIGARVLIDRVWGEEPVESDGTVSVEETRIEGMTDHLLVKQSHTTMIYSREVAEQIFYFAHHHHFRH